MLSLLVAKLTSLLNSPNALGVSDLSVPSVLPDLNRLGKPATPLVGENNDAELPTGDMTVREISTEAGGSMSI